MFTKAALAQGLPLFEIAQLRHCARELRGGTFAIGAPADHVERVIGKPPESFVDTARRYIANPDLIRPGLKIGSKLDALMLVVKMLAARVPNLARWERARGHPLLAEPKLAHDNAAWRADAERHALHLFDDAIGERRPSGEVLAYGKILSRSEGGDL